MAQTPQQRRANEKFAKSEEKKRGKPETFAKNLKKVEERSPISRTMLAILAFLLCGGVIFELLRLFIKF